MPYVTALTTFDLDFGKRVTERLATAGFPFNGTFWLYDETSDDWQLSIATALVDEVGRRVTYLRLINHLADLAGPVAKIVVISPNAPLYKALQSGFATTLSVEGARLQNTVVNGITIPNAYLYQIR